MYSISDLLRESSPNSCKDDSSRNCLRWELFIHLRNEDEITGRAERCNNIEQRSLNLLTKIGGGVGGNSANASSQALSIQGQSNLCPLSNFKLNTKAAFSTEREKNRKNSSLERENRKQSQNFHILSVHVW